MTKIWFLSGWPFGKSLHGLGLSYKYEDNYKWHVYICQKYDYFTVGVQVSQHVGLVPADSRWENYKHESNVLRS